MPRMDPRLLTIIVSSMILSTLLVATIVRPAGEAALLLLGNEFPEAILKRPNSIGLESEVSFVIMATRQFERVEIRHACLYELDPGVELSPNPQPADLPMVARLEREVEALGGEMEVVDLEAELLGEVYTGQLIDFSRFFEGFNPGNYLSALPLTYAVLSNGGDIRYFEGSPCFFLEAEGNLNYLAVSRNENKTEYFKEGQMIREGPRVSDAPDNGVLVFDDVSMDERFSVAFQVDIPEDGLRQITTWTADEHLLELVRCYADGSLELLIVNPFQRGLSDE